MNAITSAIITSAINYKKGIYALYKFAYKIYSFIVVVPSFFFRIHNPTF